MKKTLLLLGALCTFFTVTAQHISENAIGVRLGHNNGFGAEISYQRALKQNQRIEANLGFRGDAKSSSFKLTGIYQWVWNIEERLNWYAGVGGGLGNWKDKSANTTDTIFFGAGNLGIEYQLEVPLQIALDFRPEVGFTGSYTGLKSNIGLSVRYQF